MVLLAITRRSFLLGTVLAAIACAGAPVRTGVAPAPTEPLTGNWAIDLTGADGAPRKTYVTLVQHGTALSGTLRSTQFFYPHLEGSGDASRFTFTASLMDGATPRRATYEGRLVSDTLHLLTRRRADLPLTEQLATRVPAGEGAMPARIALPARHTVRDNGLARTPPMGWNSWNRFASRVDDAAVRAMADAMATNGMRDAGYRYVNIDDTWEGPRDARGNITTNRKFPDMKALADYVHARGLRLGIYSSPGPNTCAGYEGSHGHERQDAETYAAWGIDYLKYDWCGARNLYTDQEMPRVYQVMGDALLATGRPIVYSLCQYGRLDVWRWGADVGGNLWRTTGDIRDAWDSMTRIGFAQDSLAPFAAPGHWNDPDMLEIGNGGMSDDEYRTHMSLWSMLAAPLLAGNDLRTMTPAVRDILLNREIIAVDQDALGRQGHRAWRDSGHEIWTRELVGSAHAVAIFNRDSTTATIPVRWNALGLATPSGTVRDLWAHADIPVRGTEHLATVPAHGVVVLRTAP